MSPRLQRTTPVRRFLGFWTAPRIGVGLLVLSFLAGCTQLFWNNFIDEGDNIAVGTLIARGYRLYRDVFSHHFPFPYHWVALVVWCCGPSILAIRLSVLVFQTVSFAVAMWLTPFAGALGAAALIWRAIAVPYYGNLAVYPIFEAAALVVPITLTLAATIGYRLRAAFAGVAFGVFAACAVLSDPIAVYPVLFSLIALAITPGNGLMRRAVVVLAGLLLVQAGVLWFSGSVAAFVADAIRFNAQTYSKYRTVDPIPIMPALREAATLLHLFDARWLRWSVELPSLLYPDRWLCTGWLFRAAIVVSSLVLLAQRRFVGAVYLYGTAAWLLGGMGDERFRAAPFIMLALIAAAVCVTPQWSARNEAERWRVLHASVRGAFAVLLLWLSAAGAWMLITHRRDLSYAANFSRYEVRGRMLRQLACGRSDVRLAYYPSDPLMYVFADMPPASRYGFLLPWVAEIGLPEVIDDLRNRPAVVFVDTRGEIWGRKNRVYLAPLIDFLKEHYTAVAPGLYVAPTLAAQCPLE